MGRLSFFVLLFAALMPWRSGAQSHLAGLMPRINLALVLSERSKLVASIESRQQLFDLYSENLPSYAAGPTESSILFSWKAVANHTLNGGYMLIVEEEGLAHRMMQQWNILVYAAGLRLGNRLAADQTFAPGLPPEWRFRYRMAAEWPLSGTQVDPGEFYLKASHEYLWSFMPGDHDLEVRLAPVIGFEISKRNEVEAGIEHRLSRFIDSTPRQRTWLTLGWFHSISR